MICTWTWIWLAVDGPGGGTQDVSTGKWTGKETHQCICMHYEASTVEERRSCCLEEVAARYNYQQVDWQRVPATARLFCLLFVDALYEASAGAKEETVFYVSSGEFMKAFH